MPHKAQNGEFRLEVEPLGKPHSATPKSKPLRALRNVWGSLSGILMALLLFEVISALCAATFAIVQLAHQVRS